MSRFPELQGLSALTKFLAFLVAVFGVVGGFAVGGGTGFALAGVSLLGAIGYWVMARFIDILLQINTNTIDTQNELRSLILDRRRAAATAMAIVPQVPVAGPVAMEPVSAVAQDSKFPAEPLTTGPSDQEKATRAGGRVGSRVAIELLPTTAAPRGQVTISVSGGAAKSVMTLQLVDAVGNSWWRASAWTDGAGALRYSMSVPTDLPAGTYSVAASTISGGATAELAIS